MERFIKGTCMSMCSLQEIKMREKERLLHRLEMVSGTENDKYPKADLKKTVKCFSRSAADKKMDTPDLLRPFEILYRTVHYLVTEVVENSTVSSLCTYNMVWDRLRAVRQDMTVQALPPEHCALLLEPMVRFHVLYGYKLCELPPGDYDPVLNKKQLLECLMQLLLCFDAIEKYSEHNRLECSMQDLKLSESNSERIKNLTCDRQLMESLHILCNLDNLQPLMRYLKLPRQYRSASVRLSYQVAVEKMRGNLMGSCRLASHLCPLALCSFSLHLPQIQRRAFEVFSHAYNSKQLTFPSPALSRCLLFNSSEEVREVSAHYGLRSIEGAVLFSKTDFKRDARLLQPKKIFRILDEPICTFTVD